MNPIVAILITCACYFGAGRFSFDSHVGIVDANVEGRLCLNILNPHLSNGTRVSFILPHKPQRVASAIIEEKAARSCSDNPDTDPNASFYWLKLVGNHKKVDLSEPLPPAIGIVDPKKPVFVKHGIASGDLDGDGTTEFFRICTSSEGNHLTVWSGKPLQGKRRWHSYYYLGYDVVSTCKKKDYHIYGFYRAHPGERCGGPLLGALGIITSGTLVLIAISPLAQWILHTNIHSCASRSA